MLLLRCEYPGVGGNAAAKPRASAPARPRADPPRPAAKGPRVIRLKARTMAQRTDAMRAEREIRAREAANFARLNATNSERDHAEVRRAENRAVAEVAMNERFRAARVVRR